MDEDSELELLRRQFRASAFREYPLAASGQGAVDAAVRLMEEAFRLGLDASGSGARLPAPQAKVPAEVNYPKPSAPERIAYRNLGSQQKSLASRFRKAIFEKKNRPEGIAAVLHPPPFVPAGTYTETWILPHDRKDAAGVNAMRGFEKLGLVSTFPLAEGWALGWLTEWGLELIDYGDTPYPEDRPATSRAREMWIEIMSGPEHPALAAARKLAVPGRLMDDEVMARIEKQRQAALKAV